MLATTTETTPVDLTEPALDGAMSPEFEVAVLRLERAALLAQSLGWRFHLGDPFFWSLIAEGRTLDGDPVPMPFDTSTERIDHCIAQL